MHLFNYIVHKQYYCINHAINAIIEQRHLLILCTSFYTYEKPLTNITVAAQFEDKTVIFAVFKAVAFTTKCN